MILRADVCEPPTNNNYSGTYINKKAPFVLSTSNKLNKVSKDELNVLKN